MATNDRLCAFCGSPIIVVNALGEKDKAFGLCDSCAAQIEAQIPGLKLDRLPQTSSAEQQKEEERQP